MPIVDEVRSLAEDIEASFETRRAAVADIAQETHRSLENFSREHEQMANDLKNSLASAERERKEEFTALIERVKDEVAAIEKETAETLADIRTDQQEMARNVAELLSTFEEENRQAHMQWETLTKTMAAKRANKRNPVVK